ncbi:dephospho-CoA kinase [Undibacterium danionis]|uniref:Dephospho-CoA kinase n=1 Tax=Undibacterium danionis TaxID=1812100 RepID=A0ABV6IDZ1_9BURK
MQTKGFSIGLTGGIGSGKTTVANMFAELGATIIDTDLIAHQLSQKNGAAIPSIAQHFGAEFINSDGAMDRNKMRELVFSDAQAKKQLESILHPLIRQQCEMAATHITSKTNYPIFVVPLLIESEDWRQKVQRILVVDCDQETQITRVMQRNHLERTQVLKIMAAQVSREKRLAHADDVINSMADLSQVHSEVERLHKKYLNIAISG